MSTRKVLVSYAEGNTLVEYIDFDGDGKWVNFRTEIRNKWEGISLEFYVESNITVEGPVAETTDIHFNNTIDVR